MNTNRIHRIAGHALLAGSFIAATATALPASAQHDARAGVERRALNPQPLPPRDGMKGGVQERGIIIVGGRQAGPATQLQPQPQPRMQDARSTGPVRTAPPLR